MEQCEQWNLTNHLFRQNNFPLMAVNRKKVYFLTGEKKLIQIIHLKKLLEIVGVEAFNFYMRCNYLLPYIT